MRHFIVCLAPEKVILSDVWLMSLVFLPGYSNFIHQAHKPYIREDHFSGGRPIDGAALIYFAQYVWVRALRGAFHAAIGVHEIRVIAKK